MTYSHNKKNIDGFQYQLIVFWAKFTRSRKNSYRIYNFKESKMYRYFAVLSFSSWLPSLLLLLIKISPMSKKTCGQTN